MVPVRGSWVERKARDEAACYILTAMFMPLLISLSLWLCANAQSNDADKIYGWHDPGVTAPVATYIREPDYTAAARKKRVQGVVKMNAVIGTDGKVEDVKVLESLDPGLDASAIKAARSCKFKPCQKDGHPVRCSVPIEMSYKLR